MGWRITEHGTREVGHDGAPLQVVAGKRQPLAVDSAVSDAEQADVDS
jgi:hypothetical protein